MDGEHRVIFISGMGEGVVKCGSQEVMISRAVYMLSGVPWEEWGTDKS